MKRSVERVEMFKAVNSELRRLVRSHTVVDAPSKRFASGSKAWVNRQRNDHFVQRAKDLDLRARSAFKLQEIQEKHKFITASSIVLDLGAAPGGWSTIASKIVQPARGGHIIAVDLLPIQPIPNTTIIQGDFTATDVKEALRNCILASSASPSSAAITSSATTSAAASTNPASMHTTVNVQVDVVLSDMLHNTTGVADTDHYKSMDLVRQAIYFAISTTAHSAFPQGILKVKGTVLCKFLRGEDEKELMDEMKELFHTVQVVKPKSSRSESREAFILLQRRKM